MRMHVIGTKQNLIRKEWGDMKTALTFSIGDAIHFWAQNTPAIFGDKRRGWWKCLACGRTRYFGRPPKKPCKCGASEKATVYQEHEIVLKKPWMVTGHVDMFFEPVAKLFRGAELKTISGDQFPQLLSPYIQHVWQIQTYLMAVQHDEKMPIRIDDQVGYVVYISKKQHSDLFPIKVFPVLRNNLIIQAISDKLATYKQGLREYPHRLPQPINECREKKFNCYRSKFCPTIVQCEGFFEKGV